MKVSIEAKIRIPENLAKVRDKEFWLFGANEWHKFISPYVPFETGTLDETVRKEADELTGSIEYYAPHAHYQYEGKVMGPSFYSPDYGFWSPPGEKKHYTGGKLTYHNKHPLSSNHWDKAAEPTQKPKLIDSMQRYVDSGRLKLNGK